MWYIYTMECYSTIRNNAIYGNMDDLEIIMLSEVNQTEKDIYHMILFIGGILKKMIQMNLFIRQNQTQT